MPMAPYKQIDFAQRLNEVRRVGATLALAPNLIPAQGCANSSRRHLKFINGYRVAKALPPLPSLDYTGFVPALNVLAALVP